MKRRLTGAMTWILVIAGCAGTPARTNLSYGENARNAYEAALQDMRDGNCLDAEPAFKKIRREFPYSRFAALAELRAADCLFDQDKYPEAIQAYRQFVRYHPSHTEVVHAQFKIAESYYKQIPEDWLLSAPSHELDQGTTREALAHIRRFMENYEDDPRARKARDWARACLAMLARHELYVANYYLNREQHQAAVARLLSLLADYPGSGYEPHALLLLGRTYLHMGKNDQAKKAFELLVQRFSYSALTPQARAYLRAMGT